MESQEINKLTRIASLLYITTNVSCLAIDLMDRTLTEVPRCHLGNCFCQKIAKSCGLNLSYDHIYSQCDIATNVNKQIIYTCPFGFFNVIVPVFHGNKLTAALQAGPILTQDPKEYLDTKILPMWNLKKSTYEEMHKELSNYPKGDINDIISVSELMAALVSADFSVCPEGVAEPLRISSHQSSASLVDSIINFVASNYSKDISLNDAAKQAYVNSSHLSRVFNKKMNTNFRSYLNSVRINKSKKLLSETDLSLAEISNQIGFSDQSYFTKIFRKLEGVTPGQYRLLISQNNPPKLYDHRKPIPQEET